jgi:hypothetical protein
MNMTVTDLAPRAIPLVDVGPLIGCSRTKLFQLVRTGALKARKLGGLTVVLPDDLDTYVHNLPDAKENALPRGRRRKVAAEQAAA